MVDKHETIFYLSSQYILKLACMPVLHLFLNFVASSARGFQKRVDFELSCCGGFMNERKIICSQYNLNTLSILISTMTAVGF